MPLLGDRTASFIVRIWHEPGGADAGDGEWRGSIEHVGSGQRRFFRELDVILQFLRPHMEAIGIDAEQRFWERMGSSLEDEAGEVDAIAPPPRKASKR